MRDVFDVVMMLLAIVGASVAVIFFWGFLVLSITAVVRRIRE